MSNQEIVGSLKKYAAENAVANDVFCAWAMRQRARNQVTMAALYQKMKINGFNHKYEEYEGLLKFLGALGLGRLELDKRGKVIALKEVKMTLQSIGEAACGGKEKLKGFKPRNKFSRLISKPKTLVTTSVQQPKTFERDIEIVVTLEGKPIRINMPKSLSAEQIAGIIHGVSRH